MKHVDVSQFQFDNDLKFIELQKKVAALVDEESRLSARLIDATNRQRQMQAKIDAINIKILLGQATERDAQLARAERDHADEEMVTLRAALMEVKERARGAHDAQTKLESTLRVECRQRAMVAYRAKVEKLAPLLMEARQISNEMGELFQFVNVPGIPGPVDALRATDRDIATGNGSLGAWFRDRDRFEWANFGASQ